MTQSIDQLHLLILNVGLAIHNADWNWKNVSSPFYPTLLYNGRNRPNNISRWNAGTKTTSSISGAIIHYP